MTIVELLKDYLKKKDLNDFVAAVDLLFIVHLPAEVDVSPGLLKWISNSINSVSVKLN